MLRDLIHVSDPCNFKPVQSQNRTSFQRWSVLAGPICRNETVNHRVKRRSLITDEKNLIDKTKEMENLIDKIS